MVQLLLDAHAAVHAADARGFTALHLAASKGQSTVVQQLLGDGAAIGAVDEQGNTALHMAAQEGHNAIVRLLLAANADVNALNAQQQAPLCNAAGAGGTEIVSLLLGSPHLAAEGMAGAAEAAGHDELAILLLKALMERDMPTPVAVFAQQAVATKVLELWQAAEGTVSELQATWPAVLELMVSIATTHQQLQASAADITTSAVAAAGQAATQVSCEAAAARAAGSAAAAVAGVAPLCATSAAAAAAAATLTTSGTSSSSISPNEATTSVNTGDKAEGISQLLLEGLHI